MQLDVIFTGGRFVTLDGARPTATALGVLAGRVAGVDEELAGVTADRVIDLAGAPVVPGFNDAHQHLSLRGDRLRQLDLRAHVVADLDELYTRVADKAASLPAGAWVLGSGYDQNKIGAHPSRSALDRAAGDHPVWLQHCSGHMGVVNTAALDRMGVGLRAVPEVDGGTIELDADGLPNGLLTEQAQRYVFEVIRPIPFDEYVECIALASRAAVAEGLTSFTEPGIGGGLAGNGPTDLAAFLAARERGLLLQRATLMPGSPVLHEIDAARGERSWLGLDLGAVTGLGDEWVRLGPVKVFSDGSLIGRTAAMHSDYADAPGNRGFLQEDAERLRAFIAGAHEFGWQVAAHAIGDFAVDVVLDAYQDAQRRHPRPGVRHRIEHCGVADDEQIARIARLGVIPVPQGRFVSEIGDGMLDALGPDRSRLCYRQRSFLAAGVELPGSSDCPVVEGAPLLGIHDLVNRHTAGGRPFNVAEALTATQALRAYTIGSAYAVHEEHRKGCLRRGQLADFVVLSDDLLAVPPERIGDITVGATIIGGEVAYDAAGLLD